MPLPRNSGQDPRRSSSREGSENQRQARRSQEEIRRTSKQSRQRISSERERNFSNDSSRESRRQANEGLEGSYRVDDDLTSLDEVEEIDQRRIPNAPVQREDYEDEDSLSEDLYDEDEDDYIDDETFSSVPVDEIDDDENEEDFDEDEEDEREEDFSNSESSSNQRRRRRANEVSFGRVKDIESKKNELQEESRRNKPGLKTNDTFIDEDKLELKPFGSDSEIEKTIGRKIKVGNFDGRNNRQTKKQAVQYLALGMIGAILLTGAYQAIKPNNSITPEEVQSIATETVGNSGYPIEEGAGFAQNFMKSYLTMNPDDPQADRIMSYFYGQGIGDDSGSSADVNNRSSDGTYAQSIVYGPTVYSSRGISATSANYVIGALVQPRFEAQMDPSTNQPVAEQPKPKWMFFNVNVYYNKSKDSFSIVGDSPTIVPDINAGAPDDIPEPEPLGEDMTDEKTLEQINPTVVGFMKAYAVSSKEDTSAIEQYIASDAEPETRDGLADEYKMAGDDEEHPFDYTVYTDPDDPSVLKVDAIVKWQSTASEEDSATFTSEYVITLVPGNDGKYYVYRMAPKYYVDKVSEDK